MIKKNILTYLFLVMLTLLTSCSYDEKIGTYNVEVQLSEAVADVPASTALVPQRSPTMPTSAMSATAPSPT